MDFVPRRSVQEKCVECRMHYLPPGSSTVTLAQGQPQWQSEVSRWVKWLCSLAVAFFTRWKELWVQGGLRVLALGAGFVLEEIIYENRNPSPALRFAS